MVVAKTTGLPIVEGLRAADEVPHHISFALNYRARINSFQELPKDKRPPKNLWDKSHKLDKFFDEVFEVKGTKKNQEFVEFDTEDVD